jgi:hypothetical protein
MEILTWKAKQKNNGLSFEVEDPRFNAGGFIF